MVDPPPLDVVVVDGPPAAQGGTDPAVVAPDVAPPGLRRAAHPPAVHLEPAPGDCSEIKLTFLLDRGLEM